MNKYLKRTARVVCDAGVERFDNFLGRFSAMKTIYERGDAEVWWTRCDYSSLWLGVKYDFRHPYGPADTTLRCVRVGVVVGEFGVSL